MKECPSYKTLTLKLGKVILTTDISDLTYHQQTLKVDSIRKRLSVKFKKKTWVNNLWAMPRKTERGSLRFSMWSYIKLT